MGSLSFIGHLFLSGALDKKTCVLKRLDHVHKNIDTILGSIVNITIGGLCVTYFMWTVFWTFRCFFSLPQLCLKCKFLTINALLVNDGADGYWLKFGIVYLRCVSVVCQSLFPDFYMMRRAWAIIPVLTRSLHLYYNRTWHFHANDCTVCRNWISLMRQRTPTSVEAILRRCLQS